MVSVGNFTPRLTMFSARRIWKEYYTDVDAVIFLVDAAARERLGESKTELDVRYTIDKLKKTFADYSSY